MQTIKHRITYFLTSDQEDFDPARVNVDGNGASIPPIRAARDWEVIAPLDDDRLAALFHLTKRFSLHWIPSTRYATDAPLPYRASPGLHLSIEPREPNRIKDICPLLKQVGLGSYACTQTHSTSYAAKNVSNSIEHYDMHALPNGFLQKLDEQLCRGHLLCRRAYKEARDADTIMLTWDDKSNAVKLATIVYSAHASDQATRFGNSTESESVEIGILKIEESAKTHWHAIGGHLLVVGRDETPKSTLFAFPSRHFAADATLGFDVAIQKPSGLHPKLQLSFPRGQPVAHAPECRLFTYLTFPSSVFLDQYQMADQLFLESLNLRAMHSLGGETDLELPQWVIKDWGSNALIELSSGTNDTLTADKPWPATIPLHLRYLAPSAAEADGSGQRQMGLPYPTVFWACNSTTDFDESRNPFDRTDLGYDKLFNGRTAFYYVSPSPTQDADRFERFEAPVLDLSRAEHVETGTGAAVVIGFLYICYQLVASLLRQRKHHEHARRG